jgi:hypothetical protein
MLDRLILGVVLSVVGCNGLLPAKPESTELTVKQLKARAKERQLSEICLRKKPNKQSETVKKLCKGWRKYD